MQIMKQRGGYPNGKNLPAEKETAQQRARFSEKNENSQRKKSFSKKTRKRKKTAFSVIENIGTDGKLTA